MSALLKDELFEAQLLRAMGYAPYGGADVGECLAVADRIRGTSLDDWHHQWRAMALKVLASAQVSLAAADVEGARGAFFRASNYFRTAGIFAMGTSTDHRPGRRSGQRLDQRPDECLDQRLVEGHTQEVETFRSGAALLAAPPQLLAIPYEDRALPAYFFRPALDDTPRPTLVLTNGYDGTAEELYFCNGAAALARGYNVIAFDGPGQGAMVIDDGVVFRPDWENVVTPVLDVVLTLPGVDPDRIALMGLSFGGYLAPRAAAGEHRIAACVSDCGPYDLFQTTASRLPGFLAKQLPNGNPRLLRLLDRLARSVMAKPTAGWALRRNLMVHGVDSPLAYFRMAPQYSLVGLEHRITCPTFVCGTDTDDLSVSAERFYEALTCPKKKYVQFRTEDGAGRHCESGARTAFHQQVFAWLDDVLSPLAAAR